ncbi:peptidylprolyl isomerase, partial [bacterium]|nr:peptidylprolyl isomerase [bacterium]
MKLIRPFLLLFLLILSVESAKGQQLIDGIAALVGEKIILISDINQLAMEIAQQSNIDLRYQPDLFQEFQVNALEEMINVEIILLQAEVDSIYVKDRDVENTVESQIQHYLQMAGGSEDNLETYMGLSVKKLREKLFPRTKSNLLVQQMQATKFQNISVTRPEVIEFFNSYKDSLPPIPERIEIAHILKSPRASEVKSTGAYNKLDSIKTQIINKVLSFEDAALKFSQDPGSAEKGGDLGFVPRGTFVPEFEKAAFNLKKGHLSDLIKTQFGYHLLELIEKRGEQIHVRHILITLETDDDDVANTIHILSTLRKNIITNDNFEEIARTESEDPEAKENGGYLGEFTLNSLQIKEFTEIASQLKVGDISDPFQTEYGVHILKVISRKPSENIDLSKHYNIIESMV